ncbi:MAG: beta-glucosidase [Leptospirales bacterium]|nr:beta-glucosidase [Leptospirales bacterium]
MSFPAPANFLWGAATAAYQIEGAHDADGKGPSVWDDFSRRGKIKGRQSGDRACDHYARMKEDVGLMRELGLGAYRFSLSWPRILPDGTLRGGLNQAGIDFYKRLCDELLQSGIRPFATLYHWDTPLAIEQQGGWQNRDIALRFADYAQMCVAQLGDRIKDWITLNEPLMFTLLGYGLGYFPPGKFGRRSFLRAAHHALLAQGCAAQAMRAVRVGLHLGTTISTVAGTAHSQRPRDQRALAAHDALFNRLFVDPIFGDGYPTDALPCLRRIESFAKAGDLETIRQPFDFLGVNHYSRKVVKSARYLPWIGFREKRTPRGAERTAMGWEVYPPGFYDILMKFSKYEAIPALYVTENGAATEDEVAADGAVHDAARQSYLQRYIDQALRAAHDGGKLRGYFVWSLFDNLEWREGYDKRFGIVRVDFQTMQRTIKDSGRWYAKLIRG